MLLQILYTETADNKDLVEFHGQHSITTLNNFIGNHLRAFREWQYTHQWERQHISQK